MARIMAKKHSIGGQTVVAAADINVLGRKYADGVRVLDLAQFRTFYEGEITPREELAKMLQTCDAANLAGEGAVSAAIDAGIAKPADIIKIGSLPHIQVYRIPKS